MPRVPLANPSQQVQPLQPAPTQSAINPSALGASLAEAASQGANFEKQGAQDVLQTGQKMDAIAKEVQDRQNMTDAYATANNFQQFMLDRLTNQNDGYLNRKLLAAKDSGVQFGSEMDKSMGEYRKGLTNPQAQYYFDRLTIPKVMGHLEQLSTHEATELRSAAENEQSAGVTNDIQGIVAAGGNIPTSQMYEDSIAKRINSFRPGETTKEQKDLQVKKALSTAYTPVITNMIQMDQYDLADATLERIKDKIDPTTYGTLSSMVKENSLTQRMRVYYQSSMLTGDSWDSIRQKAIDGKTPFQGKDTEKFIDFGDRETRWKEAEVNRQLTQSLKADTDFIWSPNNDRAAVEKYISMIPPNSGTRVQHATTALRERFNLDETGHSKRSNDFVYLQLLNDIETGKGDPKAIVGAYTTGSINSTDNRELLKQLQTYNLGQNNKALEYTWDQIKANVKEKYDGDEVKQMQTLATLKREAFTQQIKDPNQLVNFYEQSMKKQGLFSDPMWKVNGKAEWQDAQQHGELTQWLGPEYLAKIAYGMVDPGNPLAKDKWNYNDVWAFMKSTGLDSTAIVNLPDGSTIKSNQRAWNAIGSLERINKLITAENIKRVYEKAPNGILQ